MNDTDSGRAAPCVRILGVRVDDVDLAEAVPRILAMAASRRPHHVVTVNPEFVMIARRDPAFREVLERADLALPDGIGLLHAARVLGRPLRGRATGVDTVLALADAAAEREVSFFLLGGQPGVAEAAAARLVTRQPRLRIAGTYAGSPSPDEEEEIVERVRRAAPDYLFVAYGAPQQDLWIARNLQRLGVPVAMGVGGVFDYLSGRVPWAPAAWRRLGLEWLYRLMHQPWRWRRMLALPRFALAVLAARLRGGQT
ncbi:MAG: WecB/TagA/CpsF family glycosyltransferase [Anaerolineae bacterium]|nr:WecB/TagA/CpsF family glycosyltransferase [Anaerolineae bacterium]